MENKLKNHKKKPSKIDEMTKEQIREAILKKRECNAKAQRIVENLLERGITETDLLKCLPEINRSHFDDVVEERAILHLCGYPLCSNIVCEKDIPKQKYRISVKANKVYDITARKSFCSNSCYNAANHVKKQMLTSPLWFREYEEIPKFHLLPLTTTGSMGQEVDVAITEKISVKQFTTINDFTNASLTDIIGNDDHENNAEVKPLEENENKLNDLVGPKPQTNDITMIENEEPIQANPSPLYKKHAVQEDQTTTNCKSTNKCSETCEQSRKPKPNPLNIVGAVIEKPEIKIEPILTDTTKEKKVQPIKKVLQMKQLSVAVITAEVERCLAEWFTIDTLLFLFGEEKVKEMVTDKGESIKEDLRNYTKGEFYTSNSYDQYQTLCRKLNLLELEDKKFDAQALQKEMKPLPDYKVIQEESKKMQLKVKAFLSGETEIPAIVTEPSTSVEEKYVTQLPLVDKNAQNALRRKIVCQHLNKVLPDILRSLSLLALSISSDVRLLVNTFKLRADNIMFKPIQWTLIAIVVIKILSLRDPRLAYLLEKQTAFQHMQLLLLSYKQDGAYLDKVVSWLTDVDRLLDTNDVQLTVE